MVDKELALLSIEIVRWVAWIGVGLYVAYIVTSALREK